MNGKMVIVETIIGHNSDALLNVHFMFRHLAAKYLNAAGVRSDQPEHHLDQGAFPNAIRTDQPVI